MVIIFDQSDQKRVKGKEMGNTHKRSHADKEVYPRGEEI